VIDGSVFLLGLRALHGARLSLMSMGLVGYLQVTDIYLQALILSKLFDCSAQSDMSDSSELDPGNI
jgi:hypothetical protein